MGQSFKETAHLKTDLKKYGDNYDKIFGKKKMEVNAKPTYEELEEENRSLRATIKELRKSIEKIKNEKKS